MSAGKSPGRKTGGLQGKRGHMGAEKLTKKELAFCKAYAKEENGEKAAAAAGYSVRSGRQIAYRLLQKDYIRRKISDIRKPIAQKLEEEFRYTALQSFKNLCKAQDTALAQTQYYPATGETRPKPDLAAFIKAEELKAKLAGLFDEQNNKVQDITIHIKTSADLKAETEPR